MPGLLSPLSASGTGAVVGMKRPHEDTSVPTYGQPHPKKARVSRQLHHTQPVAHFVEPLAGGFGASGDQEFIHTQLRRAIAIQCKGIGFASARPEAVESMVGLVDEFMSNFTTQLRTAMTSARRTTLLPHDYIHALKAVGIPGSGALEQHLDTGDVPHSLLQPIFAPPEPADPPPPDLEGMLGPELSGRAEKETRKYIPEHFPAFPPKHTWKATPVYAQREVNPHAIREKAAKEGIEAEKSLRKLMEKKKEGERLRKAARAPPKRSARAVKRETLWKAALKEALEEEDVEEARVLKAVRDRVESGGKNEADDLIYDEDTKRVAIMEKKRDAEWEKVSKEWKLEDIKAKNNGQAPTERLTKEKWIEQWENRISPEQKMERRIQQRVTVNYGCKFWRKNARD